MSFEEMNSKEKALWELLVGKPVIALTRVVVKHEN